MSEELVLVGAAKGGDRIAFASLVEPWRGPLFGYIYRMVSLRQDAEDLLQDVLVRALEGLQNFRQEGRFKSWLFGIATHVCLDHLRHKKRWRVEAQLIGEKEANAQEDVGKGLRALMCAPDFVFEIREHISFCFTCIGRTLPPDEQATILLREVLGFSAEEAAAIMEVSEPVGRHRLASARTTMTKAYDGLCRLIGKEGVCWQCEGLRALAVPANAGEHFVQIGVKAGVAVTPESLFDARLEIVRQAPLENGKTRKMHDLFYGSLAAREEVG
jgi:RNA polymerase sigma-70 factor, ECF subfamily